MLLILMNEAYFLQTYSLKYGYLQRRYHIFVFIKTGYSKMGHSFGVRSVFQFQLVFERSLLWNLNKLIAHQFFLIAFNSVNYIYQFDTCFPVLNLDFCSLCELRARIKEGYLVRRLFSQ
jgi:hypothetical protein